MSKTFFLISEDIFDNLTLIPIVDIVTACDFYKRLCTRPILKVYATISMVSQPSK